MNKFQCLIQVSQGWSWVSLLVKLRDGSPGGGHITSFEKSSSSHGRMHPLC